MNPPNRPVVASLGKRALWVLLPGILLLTAVTGYAVGTRIGAPDPPGTLSAEGSSHTHPSPDQGIGGTAGHEGHDPDGHGTGGGTSAQDGTGHEGHDPDAAAAAAGEPPTGHEGHDPDAAAAAADEPPTGHDGHAATEPVTEDRPLAPVLGAFVLVNGAVLGTALVWRTRTARRSRPRGDRRGRPLPAPV